MITIGGWIFFGFIVLFCVISAVWICIECESVAAKVAGIIVPIIIAAGTFFGLYWYFNETESGARAMKDQQSNLGDGLVRTVEIYDMEGELIKEYSGQFDVEMHDTHIVFDDENGKRHTVYFTTGTVAIDEQ